jgi:hypothetical protein
MENCHYQGAYCAVDTVGMRLAYEKSVVRKRIGDEEEGLTTR